VACDSHPLIKSLLSSSLNCVLFERRRSAFGTTETVFHDDCSPPSSSPQSVHPRNVLYNPCRKSCFIGSDWTHKPWPYPVQIDPRKMRSTYRSSLPKTSSPSFTSPIAVFSSPSRSQNTRLPTIPPGILPSDSRSLGLVLTPRQGMIYYLLQSSRIRILPTTLWPSCVLPSTLLSRLVKHLSVY
jgi:hypothetical protein